jgi:hypothetical protein
MKKKHVLFREGLLLELRALGSGEIPTAARYFARPLNKGYVIFYNVDDDGRPLAIPGTYGEFYDSTYVKGTKSNLNRRDFDLTPQEKEMAEKFVSLGLYTKSERKVDNPSISFEYRANRPGTAAFNWKSKEDVPDSYVSYGPDNPYYEFLLVDTEKKTVSLDSTWKENNPRRPGDKPGSQRKSPTYVIPSGNVAFTQGSLGLQKLLSFLKSADSRVTSDFKIISPDDKYKNKTLGQVASATRNIDLALKPTGSITAYHGTSLKKWEQIQKSGLNPGKSDQAYSDLVKGYSEKNVYLTFDPHDAENYATRAAVWDNSDAVVLKVEVPDPAKIIPDEDSFQWFHLDREYTLTQTPRRERKSAWSEEEWRYVDKFSDPTPGKTITLQKEQHPKRIMQLVRLANRSMTGEYYAKDIDEAPDFGSEWEKDDEFVALMKDINKKFMGFLNRSLKNLEAFAYRGRIPPKFIKKWKTYPRKAYPSSVEKGDSKAYEKTRADTLKKVKTFDEGINAKLLRLLIRETILTATKG